MKKLLLLIVSASLLILAACGGGDSESGGDSVSLKLAHSGSDSHQYQIAAEKFKELVEEKTEGDVTIEIHGNATLGSEADAVEQVMDGSVEMTTVAADSSFSNTVEEMNVFGIPYLFEDEEHIYSVLDGEIGQELLDKTEEYGMKGLGYWEVGFRHLTNNQREISEPADVEGLEIRVQPSDVWEQHMTALGAEPTPVDFNELYSALDQGVVDGQENPLPTIDSMKFYEVQDYVALTSHTYSPAIVVMNQGIYDDLSEEHQQAINEAVQETTEYHRETLAEKEDEIIQKLKDNGVTITEPNREAFREATQNVKNAVTDRVPEDLINRIEEAR